jgi:hypothetical protein
MSKRLVIVLTMTLGLLVSIPLFAHHGSASYALDKQDGFTPAPIFC